MNFSRRITLANDQTDNNLKTLLVKPVPQRVTLNLFPNRTRKTSIKKKPFSTSQSVDSIQSNGESFFSNIPIRQ